MGTSGSSKGAGSGTSLVPTFLNEPTVTPLPGSAAAPPSEAPDGQNPDASKPEPAERSPIVPPPVANRFSGARANFTTFARSGGNDRPALRRAVRDYVRSGTRGAARAVSRMGSSRAGASNALGVFRGIQQNGIVETLTRLNLGTLVGGSAKDICIGLTDVICRDGGTIDEAIARDSWLETCSELDTLGIVDLEALTADQVRDVFLTFVTRAIEGKLFQDIGVRGLQVATISNIEAFEVQFREYVARSVRDSFASDFAQLATLSDSDIRDLVDRTYRDAWTLLDLLGDV